MVSRRPTAWAGSELTLAQLLAVDVSSAKAPNLDRAVPALGLQPPATCAMVDRLARAGWSIAGSIPPTADGSHRDGSRSGDAGPDDLHTARRLQVVVANLNAAASGAG